MGAKLVASFSERLKEAIGDMTLAEVAKKIGLSKQAISTYIVGKRKPKPPTIKALSEQFNLNPMWLLGYDVPKKLSQLPNIIELKNKYLIPIVGTIKAGLPMITDQNTIGFEIADVNDPDDYFYLRISGNSMINARIFDGDLVLIKKQNTAENGQIVACLVDGESATLKRYKKIDNRILLMPENSAFEPIMLTERDFESNYAKILGVAVKISISL
jgi:repressor LexA